MGPFEERLLLECIFFWRFSILSSKGISWIIPPTQQQSRPGISFAGWGVDLRWITMHLSFSCEFVGPVSQGRFNQHLDVSLRYNKHISKIFRKQILIGRIGSLKVFSENVGSFSQFSTWRKCKRFTQERLNSQGFGILCCLLWKSKRCCKKASKKAAMFFYFSDVHLGIRVAIQKDAIVAKDGYCNSPRGVMGDGCYWEGEHQKVHLGFLLIDGMLMLWSRKYI